MIGGVIWSAGNVRSQGLIPRDRNSTRAKAGYLRKGQDEAITTFPTGQWLPDIQLCITLGPVPAKAPHRTPAARTTGQTPGGADLLLCSRTAHSRTPGGAVVHQLRRLLSLCTLPGGHAGHLRHALVSHLAPSPACPGGWWPRVEVNATLPALISLLALYR